MKKRILPLLLLIAPYIYVFIILYNYKMEKELPYQAVILFFWILVLAVYVPNIFYAFKIAKNGADSTCLLFWDMLLKLCNIPIYIMVFVLGSCVVPFPVWGIISALILSFFDYWLLIPSSMYGVNGLIQARKEGKITPVSALINGILHFFFCVDVISAIIMYRAVKKK